jgi:hypothetical protein|nr:MAG TPA: hypothetical protein [Caudoviricetes sp.]
MSIEEERYAHLEESLANREKAIDRFLELGNQKDLYDLEKKYARAKMVAADKKREYYTYLKLNLDKHLEHETIANKNEIIDEKLQECTDEAREARKEYFAALNRYDAAFNAQQEARHIGEREHVHAQLAKKSLGMKTELDND